MRKLVVSEFVSLDGIVEAPGGEDGYRHGSWTIPYFSPELGEYKTAELLAADALLLGRVQYEGFAEAWPERSGDPMSDHMNAMAKYVVSASLQDPAWNNTHLLGGDMVTAVTALKEAAGADILVAGSATLARSLFVADLVDELRMAIYPLTLGSGKRLFPDDSHLHFELDAVTTIPTGVILASYRRAEAPAAVGFDYGSMVEPTSES
jgi:dihydrofolate reductase